MTEPVVAGVALLLVEDGGPGLDDPAGRPPASVDGSARDAPGEQARDGLPMRAKIS